jgi:hypothetical protein
VAPNKIVFALDNATDIHHLVVFMTGAQPLPPDLGAVIYLGWPPYSHWQYLGYISNQKPSAVFKVHQPRPEETNTNTNTGNIHFFTQMPPPSTNTVAQIGIQLMDLPTIQTQFNVPTQESAAQLNDFITYAQKMLVSCYNFVSSFAQDILNHATGKMEKIVPLSLIDRWYQNFEAKLKRDPYFWKNLP